MRGVRKEAVYNAWRQCAHRKRATSQAQRFEVHLLDELDSLATALELRQWRPSPPVLFTVRKPKAREIHAAAFPDRVVHHYLTPKLESLYEPVFIHDVYSNRKGKGTHGAVKRLQGFMRSLRAEIATSPSPTAPRNGNNRCRHCEPKAKRSARYGYFLQLDIKNFFNCIDWEILFALLQKRLRKALNSGKTKAQEASELRWLCHRVLRQDAGREATAIASASEMVSVPGYKRLRNAGPNKGLPIGNLTSQFMYRTYCMPRAQGRAGAAFANVYLNELDQFVKHKLKCRYYLRYVDDFVLLHYEPEQLRNWREAIERFLSEKLSLALRDEGLLQPISNGVDFLGYIVRPEYRLVRRRVVGNLHEKLLHWQRQNIGGTLYTGWRLRARPQAVSKLRAVLASYLGHFSHANHYRLLETLCLRRFPWLLALFAFIVDHGKVKLLPLLAPHRVVGYRSQKRWFAAHYSHAVSRVQRGVAVDTVRGRRIDGKLPECWLGSEQAGALLRSVTNVLVLKNGFLKGGLKRREAVSLTFEPGTRLCAPAPN